MNRGFTLIEVVVALLVAEVAVLGVLGSLVLSADIRQRADRLERITFAVESIVDSLRSVDVVEPDSMTTEAGRVWWTLDPRGRLIVRGGPAIGEPLLRVRTWMPSP